MKADAPATCVPGANMEVLHYMSVAAKLHLSAEIVPL